MPGLERLLLLAPGFVLGLTVHEFAHALAAKLLGDDYPRSLGRVSLNPLRHLSALGTVLLLLVGVGWAKPVQVNLYNLKRPKLYFLLISLAGPLANVLLACICLVALGIGLVGGGPLFTMIKSAMLVNIILAIINLLPIPPLDGSSFWPAVIPRLRLINPGKFTWVWVVLILALLWLGWLKPIFKYFSNLFLGLLQ